MEINTTDILEILNYTMNEDYKIPEDTINNIKESCYDGKEQYLYRGILAEKEDIKIGKIFKVKNFASFSKDDYIAYTFTGYESQWIDIKNDKQMCSCLLFLNAGKYRNDIRALDIENFSAIESEREVLVFNNYFKIINIEEERENFYMVDIIPCNHKGGIE